MQTVPVTSPDIAAPLPAVRRRRSFRPGGSSAACLFVPILMRVLPGLAATVMLMAVTTLAAGPAAVEVLRVLGATFAMLYIGTALVSGSLTLAVFDLAALTSAVVLGLVADAPAAAFLVHGLWATVRLSVPSAEPGRDFLSNWATFSGSAALVVVLGIV